MVLQHSGESMLALPDSSAADADGVTAEQQHPLTWFRNSGKNLMLTFLLDKQRCSLAEIPKTPANRGRRSKTETVFLNIVFIRR